MFDRQLHQKRYNIKQLTKALLIGHVLVGYFIGYNFMGECQMVCELLASTKCTSDISCQLKEYLGISPLGYSQKEEYLFGQIGASLFGLVAKL